MAPTTQLPPLETWELDAPEAASRREAAAAHARRLADIALALAPALMVAYLAFRTGGYYPEGYASIVTLLALALGCAALASRWPFGAGFSTTSIVAAAALLLLVVWTWFSSGWSDAPTRALFETERTSLYLLTLVFFGAFLRRQGGLSLAITGVALAMAGVCATSLATRLYPDVFTTSSALSPQRLSFPLTYWNSLGMFAAIAVVLLFHLTSDLRAPRPVRIVAAAAIPVPALTLYFTFSRGALGGLVVGLVAYVLVGRSRGLLSGLLAAAPAAALALTHAYSAEILGTRANLTAAAAAEGHRLAIWVFVACALGGVLRLALLPLDAALARMPAASHGTRRAALVAAILAAVLACGVAVALDAPARAKDAYESFTKPELSTDARSRFRQVTLSGREDHWTVALEYYRAHPLTGEGAGTFETQWLRSRDTASETREAHSLYIEVLSELGWVGLLLVASAIGAILVGLAARARGHRRAVYGALFAGTLMWAVHAGVDWDWELPAVGVGLFALAGMGLARRSMDGGPRERILSGWPVRAAVALACILLALTAVRTVVADAALDDAKNELKAGHCKEAVAASETALSAVATDPVAHEIIGWCLIDTRRPAAAAGEMQQAVRDDPDHWRFRYGLAIARAAAGQDPRPALRLARRLNPRGEILFNGAARELAVERNSARWKRLARTAVRPRP